jgi:hypothetical protein
LVYEKNAYFSQKIAENFDQNIDPGLAEFSPIGRLGSFLGRITKECKNVGLPFPR